MASELDAATHHATMTMTFVMRVIRIMVEIVTAMVIVMLKLVLIRKRRIQIIDWD